MDYYGLLEIFTDFYRLYYLELGCLKICKNPYYGLEKKTNNSIKLKNPGGPDNYNPSTFVLSIGSTGASASNKTLTVFDHPLDAAQSSGV